MEDLVIGIDLGTTNSAVAVYLNDKVDRKLRILENKEGARITPSVVYFFAKTLTEEHNPVVGEYAKRFALTKPGYSVCEIKRLIGRNVREHQVQANLRYFPFEVDCCDDNASVIIEQPKKSFIKKTPVEICKLILQKIKSDAEDKLNVSLNKAVITVPAYFNVDQREATLKAATEAGFTVLKLLNEPTAAALSYYYQHQSEEESYSLVYDLGGGTFDVAVLKRSKNNIDIIGVDGDSHLGGKDFDNLIVDFVCNELRNNYNFDPSGDRIKMKRLHNKCEDAKKHISFAENTEIILDNFVNSHELIPITLTRENFEKMVDTLLQKTITIVNNCLKDSKLSKEDIKEVILSGGSTRIPKIQKMLTDFFECKALNKFLNPDECVAEGAAIQAALLSKNPKQTIKSINITDVVPLSLGILTVGNLMKFVIHRNTKIPVTKREFFIPPMDKQTSANIKIYEGERLIAKKNRFIGTFEIDNLTPAPPGVCKIIVNMTIDNNGILNVSAVEENKDNLKMLKVSYTRGDRSNEEIINKIKSAEEMIEEDLRFKNFAKKVNYLIEYCRSFSYNLRKQKLIDLYQKKYDMCEKFMKQVVAFEDVKDEEKVDDMIKEIKRECEQIAEKHKFECFTALNQKMELSTTKPTKRQSSIFQFEAVKPKNVFLALFNGYFIN